MVKTKSKAKKYDTLGMKETCLNCGKVSCDLAGIGNEARLNENNGCWIPKTKSKASNFLLITEKEFIELSKQTKKRLKLWNKNPEGLFLYVNHFKSQEDAQKFCQMKLQENSKCSVCNKVMPNLQKECPDCYLKGFEKERKKLLKNVFDEIDKLLMDWYNVPRVKNHLCPMTFKDLIKGYGELKKRCLQ